MENSTPPPHEFFGVDNVPGTYRMLPRIRTHPEISFTLSGKQPLGYSPVAHRAGAQLREISASLSRITELRAIFSYILVYGPPVGQTLMPWLPRPEPTEVRLILESTLHSR